MRPAERIDQEV